MTSKHKGVPRRNKSLPAAIWTACEALSWGMFGDETLPLTNPTPPNLPSPNLTYGSARRELRDAIARRAVEARGFKEDKNRPPLAREALPPDLFQRFPSLAVDVFGETTFMHPSPTQNIPVWKGIVFYEPQVRALWPKPTPLLDQWMLEDVTRRPQ